MRRRAVISGVGAAAGAAVLPAALVSPAHASDPHGIVLRFKPLLCRDASPVALSRCWVTTNGAGAGGMFCVGVPGAMQLVGCTDHPAASAFAASALETPHCCAAARADGQSTAATMNKVRNGTTRLVVGGMIELPLVGPAARATTAPSGRSTRVSTAK